MIKRLKKITPLQLGKMLAIIYGLGSLILIPFFLLFTLLASLAPTPMGGNPAMPVMLGMGIGMMVLMPIMYALMGFITGLIGALIYNLVARWIGGIEVEVE